VGGCPPAPAVLGHGIRADLNFFKGREIGETEDGLGNKPVTVKIILGTPFPGVPAGNDPW